MNLADLTLDAELRSRVSASGIQTNVWPLLMERRRGVMAVVPGGLIVFAPDGTTKEYLWTALSDFEVEAMGVKLAPAGGAFDVRLRFDHRLHSNEVATAIAESGGPRPGVPFVRPNRPEGETRRLLRVEETAAASTSRSASAPAAIRGTLPPAPTGPSAPTARAWMSEVNLAKTRLTNLFAGGVGIQLVAGVIIGLAWPTATTDPFADTATSNGSPGWVLFGFAVAWIGSVLIGVAVIGWGVMLGNRASAQAT